MTFTPLIEFEKEALRNHHCPVFGSFMQQNPAALLSLNRLLLAYDFTNIVEIGCHDGGLSTFFALYAYGSTQQAYALPPNEPSLYKNHTHHKRPKRFATADIVMRDIPRIELLQKLGAVFIHGDCLNDANVIARLSGRITSMGRTLLLCDGGDKRREVALYAPVLKDGDFIMVHDWAKDAAAAKSLRDRQIWSAWESWWDLGPTDATPPQGIKVACEANGVQQVYTEEFDDVAWFCGCKGGIAL